AWRSLRRGTIASRSTPMGRGPTAAAARMPAPFPACEIETWRGVSRTRGAPPSATLSGTSPGAHPRRSARSVRAANRPRANPRRRSGWPKVAIRARSSSVNTRSGTARSGPARRRAKPWGRKRGTGKTGIRAGRPSSQTATGAGACQAMTKSDAGQVNDVHRLTLWFRAALRSLPTSSVGGAGASLPPSLPMSAFPLLADSRPRFRDAAPLQRVRQSFTDFLERYSEKLRHIFGTREDADRMNLQRGLPPFARNQIREVDPLAAYVPEAYGGRGANLAESLAVLEATGHESLRLCLMTGIHGGLFLQPVGKYGSGAVKRSVFDGVLRQKRMGGLMITEPDFGSDALNMRTAYAETPAGYHIEGVKHWGGLTGWADYWLLT